MSETFKKHWQAEIKKNQALERKLEEAHLKHKRQEREIEKYLTRLQNSHEREEILQDKLDQLKEKG
jgi:hypothetical protein